MKRFRPRARGRAGRIHKQTCHIVIIVSQLEDDDLAVLQAKAAKSASGRSSARASRAARVAKSRGEEVPDETKETRETKETDESPYGDGSHAALPDDSMPEGFPIKGNAQSKLYHTEASPFYDRTIAEVWFATEEAAEAAGFSKPASQLAKEEKEEDEANGEDA